MGCSRCGGHERAAAVRYGILLPNVDEFANARTLVDLASAAEADGWDGVFLWDMLSLLVRRRTVPRSGPMGRDGRNRATDRAHRVRPLVTPLARRREGRAEAFDVGAMGALDGRQPELRRGDHAGL